MKAWAESLGGISYPILSDFWPHGQVAQQFGVLRREGYTERAIFIVDRDGIIRYVDIHDIDDQPSNDVLFAELRKISPEAAKVQQQEQPVSTGLPHGGVVMYCTSWCPDCRKARTWFEKHHIPYTEVNIDKTPGATAQVRKWANGNRTTPTFDIDGEIVVDFQIKRLEELLLKK